jgi:uncharacterized membrane protein YvbJ
MYCRKCGAKQLDDAVFCSECGTRLAAEGQSANPAAAQNSAPAQNQAAVSQPVMNAVSPEAAQKKKHRRIGVIAVIVAVVLIAGLVTLGVFLFGGRNYKATAKQFSKALGEANAEAIVELFPKEYINSVMEQGDFDSVDEAIENLQEDLDKEKKSLEKEYGDIELSYEVGKIKDCSKTKLKDIQKELNEFDIEIEEAKIASIEATLKHNEGKEHNDMQLVLVKIGRSWYVANWGDL